MFIMSRASLNIPLSRGSCQFRGKAGTTGLSPVSQKCEAERGGSCKTPEGVEGRTSPVEAAVEARWGEVRGWAGPERRLLQPDPGVAPGPMW